MSYLHNFIDFQNNFKIDIGLLPQLNPEATLDVYENLTLNTGDTAQLCKLKATDLHAVIELYYASKNSSKYKGKNFILDRGPADFLKMIKGGAIYGLVVGNRLAAISGLGPVKDKADVGRTENDEPWTGDGDCPLDLQQFLKSIVVHPSIEELGLGAMDIFFPHRVCEAAKHPECPYLLLKTNNPKVQEFYQKRMLKVDEFRLKEADEPGSTLKPNEENLLTYMGVVKKLLDGVMKTRPDIYARHMAEIESANAYHLMAQNIRAASGNDNYRNPVTTLFPS